MRLAPVAALLSVTACGAGERGSDEETDDGAGQAPAEETVYQGSGTVIETPDHGPQLAGVLAESYPPQGGGMDVEGWDWEAVEHEEAAGTLWGDYIVTGTFNGEALVLTEEPIPTSEVDMDDYPHLGYSEPEMPEPSEELSDAELEAIITDLAERFPEVVTGGWVDPEARVAQVDTVLVTPELEAYANETYPEGTFVFSQLLKPIEESGS
ncbi:hypothetical protein GCM10028833_26950 [Glycomyces tarimensis]